MTNTGIIILAAGSSSRLGQPKQLLVYKGKTLIERLVDEAVASNAENVIVITGSLHDAIEKLLANTPVSIMHNAQWQTGMASGIVLGMQTLLNVSAITQQVILCVCDQPYVDAALFEKMIEVKQQLQKGIVACGYAGTIGVPVLYAANYFNDLLLLKGEEGAKKLLKRFAEDVAVVDFAKGAIDIDTIQDYDQLMQGGK